jgi:HEAT repeat protein
MLGLPPLPRTIEAALRDIEHTRADVRRSALFDLVRLAHGATRPRAIAALARILLADSSAELRTDAAIGLADAKGREARAELLAALEDAHLGVVERAVLALGEIAEPGDAELLAALEPLLDHEHAALRFQTLIAFERLAGEASVRALERASHDADDEVRAMAFRLAWRRFDERAPPETLARAARSALEGPPSRARVTAALLLAAHGERAADQVLAEVIDGTILASDADRLRAIETAAECGVAAARSALARRAFGLFGVRSDTFGWQACIALSRLGDERATRAILSRLSAWNRDARTVAVAAVGQARVERARDVLLAFRNDASRADPEAVEEALSRLGRVR